MLACRLGLRCAGFQVVNLTTFPGITASERVAQKAGFVLAVTFEDYKPNTALDPEARHEVKQCVLSLDRFIKDAESLERAAPDEGCTRLLARMRRP